jgi:hypothetical protein
MIEIANYLERLSKIGWECHRGFLATRYLQVLATGAEQVEWKEFLSEQAIENLGKFKMRVKRGLETFITAAPAQDYCIASKCLRRFEQQAEFTRYLSAFEPVICPACGIAVIPIQIQNALAEVDRD